MKRKITLLRLTIVIAVLASVGIAMATVLPPPANQELGIYDTVYDGFDTDGCRGCHGFESIPDRHHMLIVNEGYGCFDCHTLDPEEGIVAPRDCIVCHTASPHHIVDAALDRHCSDCHGSFVDDYDDGHYIPEYEQSLITPEPGCKPDATNETTDKKWGGCLACHEPDETMTPVIDSNPDTHHAAVTTITCSGPAGNICHEVTGDEPPIRVCEDCHGVKSIHNIQYDYVNTTGVQGYGHIGDNWDCIGCHGWEEYKVPRSPRAEIIVPAITAISPGSLVTGEETEVTIVGDNFVTTSDGTTYSSNVVIGGDELIPDTRTATEITVTIPADLLDTGSYGLYVIKAGLRSNLRSLVVAPEVRIDNVTVDENGTVTVKGGGFGDGDPKCYDGSLGVDIKSDGLKVRKIEEPLIVVAWDDGMVVIESQKALDKGARLAVATIYGSTNYVPIRSLHPKQPSG